MTEIAKEPIRISDQTFDSETMPLVSIICNTYQHKEFIADAINGFLMQETSFPVEILIHDDASTDGTAEIVKSFEIKYPNLIKPIYQKVNQYSQGIKPSIHFQYPRALGKYIAFCEGDDYWTDPNKLQIQVNFLENNPDYVISGHDAFIIDESGNIFKNSKLPDNYKCDYSSDELILGKAWILTMSWVHRNVIKFPPELAKVINSDTFLTSIMGEYGKSKYHPEIQPAAYRIHPGGVWSTISEQEKFDSHINTWFWMYRYYLRKGQASYSQYYWNKFLIKIYSKLSSSCDLNFDKLDNKHIQNEIHCLLRMQTNKLKQLETHSKSLEKILSDIKNSKSYRLGNLILRPIKIFLGTIKQI